MKSLNRNLKPGQEEVYYPNQQSARMMWYHDHAHDITRLNAYAGVATAYSIRDTFESNLRNQGRPLNAAGPSFLVLGREGGFLPKPVVVPAAQPFNQAMLTNGLPSMLTAPAERWDFILDFKGLAGKSVLLYTDAPAPFPVGDGRNEYYAASGKHGRHQAGLRSRHAHRDAL